jgi:hypothetical protein
MARVILDVPNDKMQSFLQAILSLGLERHSISSGKSAARSRHDKRSRRSHLQRIRTGFLLFDWEFFSNELEYE